MILKAYDEQGNLKWTVEGVGPVFSAPDVTVVSSNLISKASMSVEGFEEVYFDAMKVCKTNKEAYFKAEDVHFSVFGHYRYNSYESFKSSASWRANKK